jgi:hypothetical protein
LEHAIFTLLVFYIYRVQDQNCKSMCSPNFRISKIECMVLAMWNWKIKADLLRIITGQFFMYVQFLSTVSNHTIEPINYHIFLCRNKIIIKIIKKGSADFHGFYLLSFLFCSWYIQFTGSESVTFWASQIRILLLPSVA